MGATRSPPYAARTCAASLRPQKSRMKEPRLQPEGQVGRQRRVQGAAFIATEGFSGCWQSVNDMHLIAFRIQWRLRGGVKCIWNRLTLIRLKVQYAGIPMRSATLRAVLFFTPSPVKTR